MRSTPRPRAAAAALALAAAAPAAALPAVAAAQIAPGSTITFSGVANATDIGSAGVLLQFVRPFATSAAGNTGTFATLDRPRAGLPAPARPIVVGSGPQAVRNFVTVGGFRFDLGGLPSGAYGQADCYVAPAPGQRCSPIQFPGDAISPFYLVNAPTGDPAAPIMAVIAFDVHGTVSWRGTSTSFFGTILTAFPGVSYQEALAGLEATGLAGVPFQATFVAGSPTVASLAGGAAATVSVTPEPSTVVLLATGLVGVAGLARRRRA